MIFVALMPPFGELMGLLRIHFDAATSSSDSRPGEGMFLGLRTARHALAAWWALAGEHRYERLLVARNAAGGALFVLLAAGAWASATVAERGALTWLLLPLMAAPVLAFVESYAYGAYKMMLMGWWIEVILIVRAASWFARGRTRAPAFIAACIVVGVLPATAVARLVAPVSRTFRMPRPVSMETFHQVQDVRPLVGGGPILVALHDEEASEWALYDLRDLPAALFTSHRYLVPKAAALSRGQRVSMEDVRWVLTDATGSGAAGPHPGWTLRWRGGPYALWQTPAGDGRSLAAGFAVASN
jgi:hypothetical protein